MERKERFTEAVAVQAKLSGCKEILRSARLALNDSLKGEATGGSTERAPAVPEAASAVLCERVARASDGRNEARAHSEQSVCEGFTL